MGADLDEKTDRYERLLSTAMAEAEPAVAAGTPLGEASETCIEMAASYLSDGRHFHDEGDPVNALAAFCYGHAWLDAAARIGLLSVPREGELFPV